MSTEIESQVVSAHRLSRAETAAIAPILRTMASERTLTPEAVVEAARAKSSPLHKHFVWDDTAAAHRYRLVQAAWLIRTVRVRVVIDERATAARAFVRIVETKDETGSIYVNIRDALRNPAWREQMLAQAEAELEAFRRKYAVLTELETIFTAIEQVKNRKRKAA